MLTLAVGPGTCTARTHQIEPDLRRRQRVMSTNRTEHYRKEAEGCRQRAVQTNHPNDKAAWLKMAADWQSLAESTEAASQAGRAHLGRAEGTPRRRSAHLLKLVDGGS